MRCNNSIFCITAPTDNVLSSDMRRCFCYTNETLQGGTGGGLFHESRCCVADMRLSPNIPYEVLNTFIALIIQG